MMIKSGYKCLMAEQSPFSVLWTGMATAVLAVGLVACGSSGSGNDNLSVSVPSQPVAINVLSALVTPEYTLDDGAGGGPVDFQVSEYNDGNFVLRGATAITDIALLGSSHDEIPAEVRVVQGAYDVLFQHETGAAVPQNVSSLVQAIADINVIADPLPIAVKAWTVTPTFLHNGGAFPVSEYDDGVFYLRPKTSDIGGDQIFLGNSHTAMPDDVLVMEGTYDVIYSLETGGDQVPNNQNAVVMRDVLIDQNIMLNVDVISERFQFNATLDTEDFPFSQYQRAKFFLRNASGDRVDLANSYELTAPVTMFVVVGTYDIIYQHIQGDDLPGNADAVLMSNVPIDNANQVQTPDITSVLITPTFSLSPIDFVQSEYQDANFFLRGTTNNDDELLLGSSHFETPAAVRVISSDDVGNYDVLYRHETGDGVPQNSNAVVPGRSNLALNSDDNAFAVPVTSIDVTGSFTLNGNGFPANANNSVQFLLRDASNASDEFLLGFSDIANEAVKIIPGTYHVVMDHLDGDGVPQNEMHEVDFNKVLNADMSLPVDVTAVRVNPSFTLDGQAFPASIYQSATFYLRETHSPYSRIFLGHSYKNNDSVMVIQEDYDIIYEHLYGEQTPQNSDSLLERIDL